MPNPCTIGVIVGRDLIGDALIKLPFARALRNAYPKAEIHWITSQEATAFNGVLREATRGLIDHIHECPKWMSGSSGAPHFDLLIDTRGRWKTTLQARKIPHGVFLSSAMRFLFSDRRPSLFRPRPRHLCDRLLQYVELAAGYMPPSTGSLPVSEPLLQKAGEILPLGPIYVGLAPGCSDAKRTWPRERFVDVARAQAIKGRVPVFILGPLERDWFEELKASVPAAKFPLQEHDAWGMRQLSLDHTLAVGKCLHLVVANDSGPGHIMAAVDCAVISLFGPTTPLKAAPRASHGYSIRAQSFGSAQMEAIPVESVNDAIDAMLKHS